MTVTKGEETRRGILREALDLSSEIGLEGLTIGALAKRAGMSKSGLYAHFESREGLQCAVLEAASGKFVDVVVAPALKQPRGLPRVQQLFDGWLAWEDDRGLPGGCPILAAATEYDDRPGPVRDKVAGLLKDMFGVIARAAQIAKDEGHFRGDLDTAQFAHEFWGVIGAFHHTRRMLDDPDAEARTRTAFAGLVARAGTLH